MQLAGLRNNLREMMLKLPLVSTPPCLACLCMSSHSSEADDACYWLKCVMNSTHMTWHNIQVFFFQGDEVCRLFIHVCTSDIYVTPFLKILTMGLQQMPQFNLPKKKNYLTNDSYSLKLFQVFALFERFSKSTTSFRANLVLVKTVEKKQLPYPKILSLMDETECVTLSQL